MERPNYTQVPNAFIERCGELPEAAVRCFLAICRKTIGYHKDCDSVAYSQIRKITGMSNHGVANGIRALEEAGWITVSRSPGRTTRFDLKLSTTSPPRGEVELSTTSPPRGEDLSPKERGTSPPRGETKEKRNLQKKGDSPPPLRGDRPLSEEERQLNRRMTADILRQLSKRRP